MLTGIILEILSFCSLPEYLRKGTALLKLNPFAFCEIFSLFKQCIPHVSRKRNFPQMNGKYIQDLSKGQVSISVRAMPRLRQETDR